MTHSIGKGRRSATRLLNFLAALVVMTFGVQGLVLAQTAATTPETGRKPGAATPEDKAQAKGDQTGARRQIARSINGQTVYVDPATGKLRQPTPEEAQALAAGLEQMLSQSDEGLVVVDHENGARSVSLQDRFQDVAVARVNADGSVALGCVSDAKGAEAFLKGAATSDDTRNGTAKKPARKPAKSAAGKE